jgi:hypothetical protein
MNSSVVLWLLGVCVTSMLMGCVDGDPQQENRMLLLGLTVTAIVDIWMDGQMACVLEQASPIFFVLCIGSALFLVYALTLPAKQQRFIMVCVLLLWAISRNHALKQHWHKFCLRIYAAWFLMNTSTAVVAYDQRFNPGQDEHEAEDAFWLFPNECISDRSIWPFGAGLVMFVIVCLCDKFGPRFCAHVRDGLHYVPTLLSHARNAMWQALCIMRPSLRCPDEVQQQAESPRSRPLSQEQLKDAEDELKLQKLEAEAHAMREKLAERKQKHQLHHREEQQQSREISCKPKAAMMPVPNSPVHTRNTASSESSSKDEEEDRSQEVASDNSSLDLAAFDASGSVSSSGSSNKRKETDDTAEDVGTESKKSKKRPAGGSA